VLGGICVIQCAVLFLVICIGCGLKGPPVLMPAVLILTSFVGLALGLIISAVARTSEVAIALCPLVLIPMIIFAGMLTPIHTIPAVTRPISYIIPARWAFEGLLLQESRARRKVESSANIAVEPTQAPSALPNNDQV